MKLRADDLAWQSVENEIIVLDLRTSAYLRLNATGATLWQRLADGADEDELAATLMESYDLPENEASADVRRFVDDLQNAGLLSVSAPSSATD